MQLDVAGSVAAMNAADRQAEESLRHVSSTEKALNRIDSSASNVSNHVLSMVSALHEQAGAMSLIARNAEALPR